MADVQCGICDRVLSHNERVTISAMDTLITCNGHRPFRLSWQPWLAKKEAGFKYEIPKKCVFCGTELTKDEINDIDHSHAQASCFKHKDGRTMMQRSMYVSPEVRELFINTLAESTYEGKGLLNIMIMRIAELLHTNPNTAISFDKIIMEGSHMFSKEQLIKLFKDGYLFRSVGLVSDEGSDVIHSAMYCTGVKNVTF